MPRFVVLHHRMPEGSERADHWDFMLEAGDTLRTWALGKDPLASVDAPAEALPPHRLHFLDYEGPVSANRGEVRRVAAGVYEPVEDSAELILVELRGDRLSGRATLRRHGQRWTFELSPGSPVR